jgi:hypothetical protein
MNESTLLTQGRVVISLHYGLHNPVSDTLIEAMQVAMESHLALVDPGMMTFLVWRSSHSEIPPSSR